VRATDIVPKLLVSVVFVLTVWMLAPEAWEQFRT
jgi:hypothetical protein